VYCSESRRRDNRDILYLLRKEQEFKKGIFQQDTEWDGLRV